MLKKLFIIVCMSLAVWACTDTDGESLVVPEEHATQTEILSGIRTEEEARACAMEAYATFYGASRSFTLIKDVKCVTSKGGSRTAVGDTLYYVVNTEDNAGYALIAADRNLHPVLAVTESGNIDDIENIDNPGAELFFDALSDYYFEIGNGGVKRDSLNTIKPIYPVDPFKEYRTITSTTERITGPYAPFAWGQGFPENYHFPNKIAGCGNIASLLIMSHFEEPKMFIGSNTSMLINWGMIKQHTHSGMTLFDDCGYGLDAIPHSQLAALCWLVAQKNNSIYEERGTSTQINNVNRMFKDCVSNLSIGDVQVGFPGTIQDYSDKMFYVRATADPEGGHAFVIDGKLTVTCSTRTEEHVKDTDFWIVVSSEAYSIHYSHINWGWNGLDNGYFYNQPFKVSEGYRYDDEHSTGGPEFLTNYRYFSVSKR